MFSDNDNVLILNQNLLANQIKLEDQLRTLNTEPERKELVFAYLKSVIAGSKIIFDEFPEDLDWINNEDQRNSLADGKDHVVVLDFFTYCCINCLHILPTLKKVETYYEHTGKFEVIGVHSAKFNNEKLLDNVKEAVKRHNITHKVVCDPDGKLWNKMRISCWPTVLVLGPNNQVLFSLIGENNVIEWLHFYAEAALQFFHPQLQIDNSDLIPRTEVKHPLSLCYPTKVSISFDSTKLAIADTGHNRIVLVDLTNDLCKAIGGLNAGNIDGCFESALFNFPQGLCWVSNDKLVVADTINNCLRICNFDDDTVSTLIDNRNNDKFISPWDVCIDMGVIYIACAGSHQIFAYSLVDNRSFFNYELVKNRLIKIAGTGLEENRNTDYLDKASFAQPSGIAFSRKHSKLIIADSESSSIRKIDSQTGSVKTLSGGSKNPTDLYCFGDKDGLGSVPKLQHPVGVACDDLRDVVYVADTYNHKIKEIHFKSGLCLTMCGNGKPGNFYDCLLANAMFNEPNGICFSPKDNVCYVADTNNHQIKILRLGDDWVSCMKLNFIKRVTTENMNKVMKELPLLKVSKRNTLALKSNFIFTKDFAPSKAAPHSFKINLLDKLSWFDLDVIETSFKDFNNQPVLKVRFTETAPQLTKFTLEGVILVYYCSTIEDFCSFKEVTFKIPVMIDPHDVRTDEYNVKLTFELKCT